MSWGPVAAVSDEVPQPNTKKARKARSVNGATCAGEKMVHDTLDIFAAMLVKFEASVGCLPGMFKAGLA